MLAADKTARSRDGVVKAPGRDRETEHPGSYFDAGPILRKSSCPCGGDCPACQSKSLNISHPNDPAEIEADQIADKVMRMPELDSQYSKTPISDAGKRQVAQRKSTESGIKSKVHGHVTDSDEAEMDEGRLMIQRSARGADKNERNVPGKFINSLGTGIPLDVQARSFFEPRFGHDFGDVRIHTGPQAASAAASVRARAFTLGRDVVFAAGEHDPGSEGGKRLLAHELAHVMQQSQSPSLRTIQRDFDDNEPTPGFTCGLLEMVQDDFDEERTSCCDEENLTLLNGMRERSAEAMRTAIQRLSSGAAIDGLLRRHFGESGPSERSTILGNIRQTLTVTENYRNNHTYLCRPLSTRSGCSGMENARAGRDTNITVCMATGRPAFDWTTILHEFFHVSGVALLPTYGENATEDQIARGEFETYYDPEGAESDDPRLSRYPSSEPLRNADSYAHLVKELSESTWREESTASRFIPSINLGAGFTFGGGDVAPVLAARLAFTPLGRGLHFITPGAVGLWMPGLGSVNAADPNASAPIGYVGGEVGVRGITGTGPVAGVFDLAGGVGSVFRRDETADVGALVRVSAGVRLGAPSIGVSLNADLMRIFDFALNEQRPDGWIFGFSLQGHWGGHSGGAR